jgi:hypothetical protein
MVGAQYKPAEVLVHLLISGMVVTVKFRKVAIKQPHDWEVA